MKPKIEMFNPNNFDKLRLTLREHLRDKLPENENKDLIINLIDDVKRCASELANQILSEKLGPMVFSGPEKNYGTVEEEWHIANLEGYDTHRAYLIGVEEIK